MKTLTCSLIQTALQWEDVAANLTHFDKLIQSIENTDVIVLPEMFTTGFTMNPTAVCEEMEGKTIQQMQKWAMEKKAVVVGSLIILEDGEYRNRLVAVEPSGVFASYDKHQLFTMAGEQEVYKAGKDRVIFELKDWSIRPLICYDLRFPGWSRWQADASYDLLIYVANWPEARTHHWDTLLQARAIENQAFCIGVNRIGKDGNGLNYIGHSRVINFNGEVLLNAQNQEGIFHIELNLSELKEYRSKLPFLKDADRIKLN